MTGCSVPVRPVPKIRQLVPLASVPQLAAHASPRPSRIARRRRPSTLSRMPLHIAWHGCIWQVGHETGNRSTRQNRRNTRQATGAQDRQPVWHLQVHETPNLLLSSYCEAVTGRTRERLPVFTTLPGLRPLRGALFDASRTDTSQKGRANADRPTDRQTTCQINASCHECAQRESCLLYTSDAADE